MIDGYLLAKVVAVYGLVVWAGGLIHLTFAAIPQTNILDDRLLRLRLMAGMMKRYNPFAWSSLTALIIAATYLALHRGSVWLSTMALTVLYTAFMLDFIHSFVYGPRAARGDAKARRTALLLARAELPFVLVLPILLTALL